MVAAAVQERRANGGLSRMKLITAQPARHPSPTTKASALAYVMFDRPDLDKAERFLSDFGLRTAARDDARQMLFVRGTDAAPFCCAVRKAQDQGQHRQDGKGLMARDRCPSGRRPRRS